MPPFLTLEASNHRLGPLSLRDNGHIKAPIRAPKHQLLMPPRLEEIAQRPDQDKPTNNHQRIRQPLAARDTRQRTLRRRLLSARRHRPGGGSGSGSSTIPHGARIEIDTVRVRGLREPTRGVGVARRRSTAHVKAVLDESDAQASSRTILGGVRGVEEVC